MNSYQLNQLATEFRLDIGINHNDPLDFFPLITNKLKNLTIVFLEMAEEISEAHRERLSPFTFSMCSIAVGEQVEFCWEGSKNNGTLCTVVDDKHIEYNGQRWSLTALAKHLLGVKWAMAGPRYFKYKGEWLNDIRHRLGN
jgi:hypothetical protein